VRQVRQQRAQGLKPHPRRGSAARVAPRGACQPLRRRAPLALLGRPVVVVNVPNLNAETRAGEGGVL
jgi:hypothetical protein